MFHHHVPSPTDPNPLSLIPRMFLIARTQEGKLVPVEIVVNLLKQAMEKHGWSQVRRGRGHSSTVCCALLVVNTTYQKMPYLSFSFTLACWFNSIRTLMLLACFAAFDAPSPIRIFGPGEVFGGWFPAQLREYGRMGTSLGRLDGWSRSCNLRFFDDSTDLGNSCRVSWRECFLVLEIILRKPISLEYRYTSGFSAFSQSWTHLTLFQVGLVYAPSRVSQRMAMGIFAHICRQGGCEVRPVFQLFWDSHGGYRKELSVGCDLQRETSSKHLRSWVSCKRLADWPNTSPFLS